MAEFVPVSTDWSKLAVALAKRRRDKSKDAG